MIDRSERDLSGQQELRIYCCTVDGTTTPNGRVEVVSSGGLGQEWNGAGSKWLKAGKCGLWPSYGMVGRRVRANPA